MGRATIVEHLGNAFYTIDVHRDNPRTTAVEQLYRDEAAEIDSSLATLESKAQTAKNELDTAWTAYESDPSLFNAWIDAVAAYEISQGEYLTMQLRKQNLDAKANDLQGYTATRRVNAWCSTYTTNLAPGTVVGTAEVARHGSAFPYHVILPTGQAPINDDGQMRHLMSMTPAQAFMNYALLPGAVKWRQLYATGHGTKNDDGTLTISLDHTVAAGFYIFPMFSNGFVEWDFSTQELENISFEETIVCGTMSGSVIESSWFLNEYLPLRRGGFDSGIFLLKKDDSAPSGWNIVGYAEWPKPLGEISVGVGKSKYLQIEGIITRDEQTTELNGITALDDTEPSQNGDTGTLDFEYFYEQTIVIKAGADIIATIGARVTRIVEHADFLWSQVGELAYGGSKVEITYTGTRHDVGHFMQVGFGEGGNFISETGQASIKKYLAPGTLDAKIETSWNSLHGYNDSWSAISGDTEYLHPEAPLAIGYAFDYWEAFGEYAWGSLALPVIYPDIVFMMAQRTGENKVFTGDIEESSYYSSALVSYSVYSVVYAPLDGKLSDYIEYTELYDGSTGLDVTSAFPDLLTYGPDYFK